MRRVFVTGSSGFVGVQLVKRLREAGVFVRCLVRKTSRRTPLEALDVEFIEGDVRDISSLRRGVEGVDAVFHIAGVISANTPEAFMDVNRYGCRNIAETIASLPEPKPVLISLSSQAAAGAGHCIPKTERRGAQNTVHSSKATSRFPSPHMERASWRGRRTPPVCRLGSDHHYPSGHRFR
jgi:nucleoside-diphosphate-sugar epimerase